MAAWPGWSDEDTLVLPLQDAPPTAPVEIDGRLFAPKDELHVTLVGARLGAELHRLLGPRREAATRPAFEALDWSLQRTGRGVLIEKHGRRDDRRDGPIAAVAEFVEVPALAHYYRWLGSLLGRELPVPPAHVTLYTHGRARGIGLPTLRALRALRRADIDPGALAAP